MAHQILADVEELFEDPFGPVVPDGVVAGHGGQLGFLTLKNHIGGPQLSQELQQVIDYVKNDVNSDWLELAGYQRDKETNTFSNKMNYRTFNATDGLMPNLLWGTTAMHDDPKPPNLTAIQVMSSVAG